MDWTNRFGLPAPLYSAIANDLYHTKRDVQLRKYMIEQGFEDKTYVHLSVSDLIKSPRQRILGKRHQSKMVKDVTQNIFSFIGTCIHTCLREVAKVNHVDYIAEERMFTHLTVNGTLVIISGEPDLVTPDGELHDYKFTAVWGWLKGVKDEWEKQTNLYAYIRFVNGHVTNKIKICFFLRDWKLSETVQQDYPKASAQMMDVKMWTIADARLYMESRIKEHLAEEHKFDDEIKECTADEMWEKPEAWAVKKEGSARAYRVIKVPGAIGNEAAHALAETMGDGYTVEHRPGERTRCQSFCDAAFKCNQYNEYVGAAIVGRK